MIVKIHGTRGSLPACGSRFEQFGGNTTCLSIDRQDGELLIVDAGTGLYHLAHQLKDKYCLYHFLFTHFHWDHIQGLPFFGPLYNRENVVELTALDSTRQQSLREILNKQMQPDFFPIGFEEMGADLRYEPLADPSIQTIDLNHPGGCAGFKITAASGKTLAYLVDHELTQASWQKFCGFCEGVDLLIHDAHYTDAQYQRCTGWGHSSYSQAMDFALDAQVKQLILTHHHPDHDDDFLLKQEEDCQKQFPNCQLARENMILEL